MSTEQKLNQLQKLLVEVSDLSHKNRKAYVPIHYAHRVVAMERLGASEKRIREFIDW